MTWLAVLLACGDGAPGTDGDPAVGRRASPVAPDLVWVGVAGLRADPLVRGSEPFHEAFGAERGVQFPNAYAQSTSTFVSLGSVLTGRYPSAIPLCGFPTAAVGAEAPWCTRVPSDVPTLPGVLSLYGYRTAFVSADITGAASFGALFDEHLLVSDRRDDAATDWGAVARAAQGWWDADASRPRLLVVATADLDMARTPGRRAAAGIPAEGTEAPVDRARVESVYQGAGRAAGSAAQGIVQGLRGAAPPRPLWAATFGIHGINLQDTTVQTQVLREGNWSDIVMDRTIRVPLAIWGPAAGLRTRSEPQLVELVDLLPTFLRLAGAVLPSGLPGQDLLADDFATDPDAIAYAEFGDMLALRQGQRFWSLRAFFFNRSSLDPELTNFILDFQPNERQYALHDLSTDPLQERNLLALEPALARALHARLVSVRTGPGAPPRGALDARKIWALRMSPADGYW
jgi:arylsulfatase A-like enzyme